MTDERIGQQFGNYQLVRLLGQGGFADVYLGEHLQLKSLAAIKVLYARLNNELREGFLNEARILARLNHPHIIHTLEFGLETDGVPYLAMDYASQGTVRQRHPNGSKVPLEKVVGYVQQVADALQYAHDQKLIHRDLKPDNILIGEHNGLLLSDFGVAIVSQTTSRSLTAEKSIVGTMSYMAPEQLQGKAQRASDQYSLGIIVYEWLCGTRPFHGTVIEVFTQHVSMRPAPLRDHVPELSTTVEQVVLKVLEKDPAQRFANVRDFAAAFAQASRGEIPAFIGEHTLRVPLSLPDASSQSALSGRVVVPPTLLSSARFPAAQAAFEMPASPYPTLTTPSSTTAPDEYNSPASGSYSPMPASNTTPPGLYASASATPFPPTQLAPSADYTPPSPFAAPSGSLPPTQLAPSAGSVLPASGFLPPISTIDRPIKIQRLSTGKIALLVALIALVILGGSTAAIYSLHRTGNQGNQGIAGTSNNGGQSNAPGTSGNTGTGNNGSQSNGSNKNGSGGNGSKPQPTATSSSARPTATSGANPTATTAPKPTATPKPTAQPSGAWPNMKEGSSGENVYSIQLLLKAHGYSLGVDGQFGSQTTSTVKAFQSAHGLSVDGQVGSQTWPVLIIQTQLNSTGYAVQAVQRQLNAHGANVGVDGQFGPATQTAVRNYQSSHGLEVDGQAGPQTWLSLVSSTAFISPGSWLNETFGSTGENVYSLQLLLLARGYTLGVAGQFHQQTEAVVKGHDIMARITCEEFLYHVRHQLCREELSRVHDRS